MAAMLALCFKQPFLFGSNRDTFVNYEKAKLFIVTPSVGVCNCSLFLCFVVRYFISILVLQSS